VEDADDMAGVKASEDTAEDESTAPDISTVSEVSSDVGEVSVVETPELAVATEDCAVDVAGAGSKSEASKTTNGWNARSV
jgi:Zn finger protein HypA/HybF involved in hydrogenase expression